MEESTQLYKDFRFWLAAIAFGLLAWMVVRSYPM